ncbi:glutaminase A [Demequina oxidasica]|uniref:glutaminase A n=1 Tax=Demequina oxidasica TaxID=676199 RepID=UPI000B31BB04|nr:glutaminase A [Demequina oxidasica]
MTQVVPSRVLQALERSYLDASGDASGTVSSVYPVLADAEPELFGAAVVEISGEIAEVGDCGVGFSMMSCAKPFVFALVAQARGISLVRERVGVNATGLPFNSATAVERDPTSRTNPMVNSGALATIALTPGDSVDDQWQNIIQAVSEFAGRALETDPEAYASVSAANHQNRALAHLLSARGALASPPGDAVELYTRASCLVVSTRDLAAMGATLANSGTNPLTGDRVVDGDIARASVAVMATSGLYETTGDWMMKVGLPAKSGISGNIVTVAPGRLGLASYAPRLDAAGNSVKGAGIAQSLARDLRLDIFSA